METAPCCPACVNVVSESVAFKNLLIVFAFLTLRRLHRITLGSQRVQAENGIYTDIVITCMDYNTTLSIEKWFIDPNKRFVFKCKCYCKWEWNENDSIHNLVSVKSGELCDDNKVWACNADFGIFRRGVSFKYHIPQYTYLIGPVVFF